MPQRILNIMQSPGTNIVEFLALSSLAIWQGFSAMISPDTWEKITGPHGLVFVLIIGLIVVWTKSVRDDASRERRHKETIKSQQDHFEALIDLNEKTANDLKLLTVASTKAQMSSTNAIISMDHNIVRLTDEIAGHFPAPIKKPLPRKRAKKIPKNDDDTADI